MLMTLNRNYTMSTTLGHSIFFKRGTPTHVPPALRSLAISIGAVPADGGDPNVLPEDELVSNSPVDPEERAAAVRKAIDMIVRANERGDFTAAGVPTVAAVTQVAGWKVQAREIAQEWQARGERALAADMAKDTP